MNGAIWLGFAAILGAIFGSFLSVVIVRLPKMMRQEWREAALEALAEDEFFREHRAVKFDFFAAQELLRKNKETLSFPRSHCTICGHFLSFFENLPLIGFLAQRGRCRACGAKIGAFYLGVELAAAAAAIFVAYFVPFAEFARFLATCAFFWALIAAAAIDFRTQFLPDALTLPLVWAGVLAAALGANDLPLEAAVFGAAAGYGVIWATRAAAFGLLKKEAMGLGDAKFLAAILAWLGVWALPEVLILAGLSAVIVFVLYKLVARKSLIYLPFGPCLALAAAVLFAQKLAAQ